MASNPFTQPELQLSPFAKSLVESLIDPRVRPAVAAAPTGPSQTIRVQFADPNSMEAAIGVGAKGGPPSLTKSILNMLNGGNEDSIERLAFEIDPQQVNQYQSLYR